MNPPEQNWTEMEMPNPPPRDDHDPLHLLKWVTDALWITLQKVHRLEVRVEDLQAQKGNRLFRLLGWAVVILAIALLGGAAGAEAGAEVLPRLVKILLSAIP